MKRIQLPNGTVVSVPDNYGNAPTPNSSLVTGRPEFQHPERRQGIRGPEGQSQNPSNMGLVLPTNKRKPLPPPVPGQGGLPNLAAIIGRLHQGRQVRQAPSFSESLLNAQF